MAETNGGLDALRQLVRTCPVIDNHAHNLLRGHLTKADDFLTISTEATGDALSDHPRSLVHLRAAKQLRELYGLPADTDWNSILKRRAELLEEDGDTLRRKCFQGTETILVDDGLGSPEQFESYSHLDQFTASPCKRIVRIETVAASIMYSLHQKAQLPIGVEAADEEASALAWVTFITEFEQTMATCLRDPEIVGFKSVVCYRTGLDVRVGRDIEVTEDGLRSFRKHYLPDCVSNDFRIQHKGLNDALVISTCKLIAAAYKEGGDAKPLQFHTGLGDNDISLLESNPAFLQPLIKSFPTVPIVLLHSSYPYTREAGYLATVYKNVYLDIGEVFPMVSREGQEKIIRQALELTPTSKILWSTDGHHYAETYYLANLQGRDAVEKVLVEYVHQGDLTARQAMQAVTEIFYSNSNRLYHLHLPLTKPKAAEPEPTVRTKKDSISSPMSAQLNTRSSAPEVPVRTTTSGEFDCRQLPQTTRYIIVQWIDYMAQMRTRAYPLSEFENMVRTTKRFSISYGNLGTLQNDGFTELCNPVGQIFVEPDLRTLRPMWNGGDLKDCATVMARFTGEDGQPLAECPRSRLESVVRDWYDLQSINILVGFEIEITFCKRSVGPDVTFEPLDTNHAWGTFSDEQYITGFPLLTAIIDSLHSIDIKPQAFHSESGAGQYEIVLPPLPPVLAVDTLVQARQCIQQVAAAKGLRATMHPLPFPGIGTAAHAHISLNSSKHDRVTLEKIQQSFLAVLLAHLPALCAVTLPQAVSYGRVVADHWTSGLWVAWGPQNREVPIRQSAWNRWEIRCLDGTANMYLAMFAILGTGLFGVRDGTELKVQGCSVNPSKMSHEQLGQLGVTRKLPTTIEEALSSLEDDSLLLKELDGDEKVGPLRRLMVMKRSEQKMLADMAEEERRIWLIERY